MPSFFTNAFDFLTKGGVVMVFIFICSIVAVVLFIERWIAFRTAKKHIAALKDSFLDAIKSSQFERAMTLCDTHPGALAALAKCIVQNRTLTREAIQEAVQDESKRQFAALNRFVPAIGMIASISPLLGLLGTVTGMIQVFSSLADEYAAGAHANPGMLAGGIWEALLTTAAGLCVAIPAYLMHRWLDAKLDAIYLELEAVSTQAIDVIAPPPIRSDAKDIKADNKQTKTSEGDNA